MKTAHLTDGQKVCQFIERFCMVPDGALVGQPMRLLDFQREFIEAVYDNPAGTRRAYLSIARKNGKSSLVAALLLAHLVGPMARQNAQIVCGARSREQASIIFALACQMVRMNDRLKSVVAITPSSKQLVGLPLNTQFRSLAAEAQTAHGLSPALVILDEVGLVRGPQDDFVTALETAQGAHRDPLLIAISTQAPSSGDMFALWLDEAATGADPRTVARVWAAPEGCDLMDEAAWHAANPALGSILSVDDMRYQAERAAKMPAAEPAFRNYHLNQRVNAHSPFVAPAIWDENAQPPDPRALSEGEVIGGLDLSQTTDLSALVLVALWRDHYHVFPTFWLPAERLDFLAKRDRQPYRMWADAGLLNATPGAIVDYAQVADEITRLVAKHPRVRAIAFDRYNIAVLQRHLGFTSTAVEMIPFGQGWVSMSPAVTALEEALLTGRVRHGNHPVLRMCARHAVVKSDPAGNRKLDKAMSTGRIDGMVALAMAIGSLSQRPVETNDAFIVRFA